MSVELAESSDSTESKTSLGGQKSKGLRKPPKKVSGEPKNRQNHKTFSVSLGPESYLAAALVNSVGIATKIVHTSKVANPHMMGGIERRIAEYQYLQGSAAKNADHFIVTDPRDNEAEFYREQTSKMVYSQRLRLYGDDSAAGRMLVNEYPTPRRGGVYIFCDNAYWLSPAELYATHGFCDHPDFAEGGVQCVLFLKDFRTNGGSGLFLFRYKLEASPKREERTTVWEPRTNSDGDPIEKNGRPIMEPVKKVLPVPEQKPVDLFESYAVVEPLSGGGTLVTTRHGLSAAYGSEGGYTHEMRCDAFFNYKVIYFMDVVNGVWVECSCHADSRVFYQHTLRVVFRRVPYPGPNIPNEKELRCLVLDGRIPLLENYLVARSESVNRNDIVEVNAFKRLAGAVFEKMVPTNMIDSLGKHSFVLHTAYKSSIHHLLYSGQQLKLPVVVTGGGTKAQVQEHMALQLAEQTGMGVDVAERLVAMGQKQTKFEFGAEVFVTLKLFGSKIHDLVKSWVEKIGSVLLSNVFPKDLYSGMGLNLVSVFMDFSRYVMRLKNKLGRFANFLTGMVNVTQSDIAKKFLKYLEKWAPIVLRVLVEEGIKNVHPIAMAIFVLCETVAKLANAALLYFYPETRLHEEIYWEEYVGSAMVSIVGHILLSYLPFPVRVLVHAAFNGLAPSWWRRFRAVLDSYLGTPGDLPEMECQERAMAEIPVTQTEVLVPSAHGMRWEPLSEYPNLLAEMQSELLPPMKKVAFDGSLARLFVRPTGTAAEMVSMIANRLEPALKNKPNKTIMRKNFKRTLDILFKDMPTSTPLTVREFEEYLLRFPERKRALYEEKMEEVRKQCESLGSKELLLKVDESLVRNATLLEFQSLADRYNSYQFGAKGRPIIPIDASEIELFMFLLAFKKFLKDPLFDAVGGKTFSSLYLLVAPPGSLNVWYNNEHSAHFDAIHLGDDLLAKIEDEKGDVYELAGDAGKCDKTCGEVYQTDGFAAWLTKGGCDMTVVKRFLDGNTGERTLAIRGEFRDLYLRWKQTVMATNTGGPATSLQAYFAILVPTHNGWRKWAKSGASIKKLVGFLESEYMAHGLEMDWERGVDGQVLGPPGTRSFLGGFFAQDSRDVNLRNWLPLSMFGKGVVLFPYTAKIYGVVEHVAQHALAIAQNWEFGTSDFGQDIKSMLTRIAKGKGVSDVDSVLAKYSVLLSVYELEQSQAMETANGYTNIADHVMSLAQFCANRGYCDPTDDFIALRQAIKQTTCLPADFSSHGVLSQYVPRNGVPKVAVSGLGLDLLPISWSLGRRINTFIQGNMVNGKKSKSKSKPKVKIVEKRIVEAPRGHGKAHRRSVPTQNAFNVSGGYDPELGLRGKFAYTSDKYDVHAKLGNRGRERLESELASRGRGMGQGPNQFGQRNPNKDVDICFDELLGTISGSTAFTLTDFNINPGQVLTFPQTSKEAALYERYVFTSLEFYLTPLVTVFNSAGKVLMSCDLEGIEEPSPSNVGEMENNTIHSDGMPHQVLGFQLAGVTRHHPGDTASWFVRTGRFPGGADPRLYDIGKLYVATYGNPAAYVGVAMTELRVRGCVRLMDKLSEPLGYSLPHTTSQFCSQMVGTSIGYGGLNAFNWGTAFQNLNITTSGWSITAGNLSLTAPLLTSYYMFVFNTTYKIGGAGFVRSQFQLQVNGVAKAGGSGNRMMATDYAAAVDPGDYASGTYCIALAITTGDLVSLWYDITADGAPASALLVVDVLIHTL